MPDQHGAALMSSSRHMEITATLHTARTGATGHAAIAWFPKYYQREHRIESGAPILGLLLSDILVYQ